MSAATLNKLPLVRSAYSPFNYDSLATGPRRSRLGQRAARELASAITATPREPHFGVAVCFVARKRENPPILAIATLQIQAGVRKNVRRALSQSSTRTEFRSLYEVSPLPARVI